MDMHGYTRIGVDIHAYTWTYADMQGWICMGIYAYARKYMDTWISVDIHEYTRIYMDI